MNDREKTIKEMTALRNWLLHMEEFNDYGNGDMYHEFGCTVYSALELLKEQEAIKPKRSNISPDWVCGKCGVFVSQLDNYCPRCGNEVKWFD